MAIKLAVIMDPITLINIKKDSTFAMLLEAQNRGWRLYYLEQKDVFFTENTTWGEVRELYVKDDASSWCQFKDSLTLKLEEMNVILMRKDPPFDMEYVYTTYLLERIPTNRTMIINNPAALRDANEKFFATSFTTAVPSIVTRKINLVQKFLNTHHDIVVKPLDAMGGDKVFRIQQNDLNKNAILEMITALETQTVIAQKFIPDYVNGDKRILIINGTPVPHALVRIPAANELRANLAKGGTAQKGELTKRDHEICNELQPVLRKKGLFFVGIDVIGKYLTEINVTSPTGIRELDRLFNVNISKFLCDEIERCLHSLR